MALALLYIHVGSSYKHKLTGIVDTMWRTASHTGGNTTGSVSSMLRRTAGQSRAASAWTSPGVNSHRAHAISKNAPRTCGATHGTNQNLVHRLSLMYIWQHKQHFMLQSTQVWDRLVSKISTTKNDLTLEHKKCQHDVFLQPWVNFSA